MLEENIYYPPMAGTGGPCCIHGSLGGLIQGVAIYILGPLAALVHFGSCYAYQYRTAIRERYGIPGGGVGDCCTHYWCGPCAICQEHIHLRDNIMRPPIQAIPMHGYPTPANPPPLAMVPPKVANI
eukprot:CAMPEP_0197855524 /NCGR_PEP_ID=MMETSP1438-20131217/26798_1 /TAXON_ID=1461541 /ORGANISM="Pterosperma sp., Strain CCMP1384" /LENGTH=125 /DNA_ID=CAMNT_0043470669 /DNA_START=242 /DNA_END=619 /DNA_ORIENTATION=+